MKTLTGPSSGIISGGSSRDPPLRRPESFVRLSRQLVRAGVLRSVSARRRTIKPVFSLSSESKVELDGVEDKSQAADDSRTVHVKFQIQRECSFGDEFLLVGDDPMLGLWDPDNGISLTWSDDHVWTAEMEMPIGKTIQYKFILKESTGTISWQPGPDRIFKSWETINVITVSEDWEDAENQKLIEDDGFPCPNVEPAAKSEVPVMDKKSKYPKQDPVSKINDGSVVADGKSSSVPSQAKPVASVPDKIGNAKKDFVAREATDNTGNAKKGFATKEPTDNIRSLKKDLVAKESNNNVGNSKKDLVPKEPNKALGDKRTSTAKMEPTAVYNKDQVIAKDALAQSNRVAEVKNTSMDANKDHTKRAATPVPVPGLSLERSNRNAEVKNTSTDAIKNQTTRAAAPVSEEPTDTTDFNPPELDKKQETKDTLNNGEESQASLKQWPLSAKDGELHTELIPRSSLCKEEEEVKTCESINGVYRTLQKLLVNLGLA